MTDAAVVIKTRKFMKNPLLARRQVRVVDHCCVSFRSNFTIAVVDFIFQHAALKA